MSSYGTLEDAKASRTYIDIADTEDATLRDPACTLWTAQLSASVQP